MIFKKIILISIIILLHGCGIKKEVKRYTSPNLSRLDQVTIKQLTKTHNQIKEDLKHKAISNDNQEYRRNKFKCPNPKKKISLSLTKKVNMELLESDIREALLELSIKAGVPIVVDPTVEGVITANIKELSISSALNVILSYGGYSYKYMQDYILVGSSELEKNNTSFHLLSVTCLYKPNYTDPKKIMELLSPFYRPFVTRASGGDFLAVSAPNSMQQKIQSDIMILDQPIGQILLEIKIVELQSIFSDSLGITPSDVSIGGNVIIKSIFDQNISLDLFKSLKILNQKGLANIKAMPSIITQDNKPAIFKSDITTWIDTSSARDFDVSDAFKSGIDIKIIPHILNDNTLRLDIEKLAISDLNKNSEDRERIIAHEVSSTVRIKNNQTLILGGLLQKRAGYRYSGISQIRNIPLIGHFFNERSLHNFETELLIVITPRIIHG